MLLQTWTTIALVASPSSHPALLQEEHHQDPEIALSNNGGCSPRSITSSVRTAPSPSQVGQSTSPILPIKPNLIGVPLTPVSSGRHQRTGSVYYTASWGSPFQPPELSSDKITQGGHNQRAYTEELGDDSPIPQLRFNYLLSTNQSPEGASTNSISRSRRRAYASKRFPGSSRLVLADQGVKKPAREFTEDWVRQYLAGQSHSERGNWWSDDSDDNETSNIIKSRERQRKGHVEDWLNLDGVSPLQGDAGDRKSLTNFISHPGSARAQTVTSYKADKQGRNKSASFESDTGDIFGDRQILANKGNYMAEGTLSSKFASPYPTPMEEIDLNLPQLKADESGNKDKDTSRMEKPAPSPKSLTPADQRGGDLLSPGTAITPAKSSTQPSLSSPARTGQRPKKRTVWRGRNCVIALPLDDSRGKSGGAPFPLSRKEIQDRLQSWESDGFDTSSFKLATTGESQSRHVYPSSDDERAERKQGDYLVTIPDHRKWEAYVKQLKEQKLRALGVTSGHEDLGSGVSARPSAGSRQASSQFARSPISPAMPTYLNQHSRAGSIVSPGLRLPAAHMARPPVSPLASAFQYPQATPAQPSKSPQPRVPNIQSVIVSSHPTQQNSLQQTHILHQPQPRAVLAHRLYGSNIFDNVERRDTSNSSTLSSNSWTDSKPTSTDSVLHSSIAKPMNETAQNPPSKLNVEAKEFTFGPTSSTLPRNFFFNSGTNPQSANRISSRPLPFSRASSATYGTARKSLNVAAAPFQPSLARGALPAGDFNFSSAGPTYKRDASRSFEEGPIVDDIPNRRTSAGPKGRIFSSGSIGRPPRKNKAIPIVRPDDGAPDQSEGDDDDDGVEDESGRITQGIGRQKRLRRGGGDGNDVPQFAMPSELSGLGGVEPTDDETEADQETTPSDKENITPDIEGLKAKVHKSARVQHLTNSHGNGNKEWDPFIMRREDEAEHFDTPLPRPSSGNSDRVSVYEDQEFAHDGQYSSGHEAEVRLPTTSDLADADIDFPLPPLSNGKHSKFSSLSALSAIAKSFEYKPSATTTFSSSVGQPATHNSVNRKFSDRSEASFDPSSSSPHALNESPATTLRPSEVGSFRADMPQPRKHSPYHGSESKEYDAFDQASVENIDAVMEQLNGDDSDLGVERAEHIWGRQSPKRAPIPVFDEQTPAPQLLLNNILRSDAPSPSPNRVRLPYNALCEDEEALGIHRLNIAEDVQVSDWDDALSPAEDAKLESRTSFFDNRVNDLVGGLLQERLHPLERTLHGIRESLSALAVKPGPRRDRRSFSPDVVDSDADDEDESDDLYRPQTGSPKRDRKLEQIKAVIAEALSAHQAHQSSRSADEDVRQNSKALEISDAVSSDKFEAHEAAEDRIRDLEKQLLTAEEEKTSLREIAEENLGERRQHDDSHHQDLVESKMRTALLEGAQENLQRTVSELQDKNAALEGTLAEYRLSSDNWREEIAQATEENNGLSRTIESLKLQMEESVRIRESLRGRFDKLQEDMASAAHNIARDQAMFAKKEGDHRVELEVAIAKLVTEERARAHMEKEVERLKLEEKEAIRLSAVVEETIQTKKELQTKLDSFRHENLGHQQTISRLQTEVQRAEGVKSSEVQATKPSMAVDLEAAQHELRMVRADLEAQLTRARTQVENAYSDAADAKVTSTSLLQEAMDAQRATIEDLRKDTEDLVRDRQSRYEMQLEEIRSQHDRALSNAEVDKSRLESHLLERLSLSDAKSTHLQDRVTHLEERLEIAKSAAHAAVQAAQSAKGTFSLPGTASQQTPTTATTQAPPSNMEKISPQALRESIFVLQEQLQERERTIESLEQEISTFDRSLPAKFRERDSEVTWLREILSVRIADLQDIITTISSEHVAFNRDAVKDAAIRLKAGLEMELQERERASGGAGGAFPSLASVRDFATPRATQLAAAWGNWRKGKENMTGSGFGDLSDIARSATVSPSKAPPSKQKQQQQGAQGFFSGLMTPPPRQMNRQGSSRDSQRGRPSSGQMQRLGKTRTKEEEMKSVVVTPPPETPTLLREGDYDQDAQDGKGYFDDQAAVNSDDVSKEIPADVEV